MRKLYTIFLAVLLTSSLSAQAPQKMSYQAVIRNSSDALVTNHLVGMKISILQGSSTGTPVFVETQIPTTNANGLVTIEIGSGTPVTGTLAGIDWSTGTYFIKTETDPTGGTSYSITGTNQILSVPYSLYSKTASTSDDAVKITGDQSIAGTKSFTGTISASDKVITNVATPVSATDASNKAYVDELKQRLMELEDIVYTNTPLPSTGLVAYYPFNGNANDGSSNGNTGIVNGPTLTEDRFGNPNKAYSFDGINDYINIGTAINVTNYTISGWVKILSLPTQNNFYAIVSRISVWFKDFELHMDPNQYISCQHGTGTAWSGIASPEKSLLNHWIHALVTYDGSTQSLYLNGKNVASGEIGSYSSGTGFDTYIGARPATQGISATQFFLNGSIDDIRIYNRAINDSEVKQLYNEGGYPNSLITDIDGNSYKTVKIGTQVWMAENLKTTKYSDGAAITNITDGAAWVALTTPAYCWYNNDASAYKDAYGGLYNLYAVMTGKLCPTGWHVPTNDDWNTLGTYLGGTAVAGGKMKETGTTHWLSPNVGATNESGFNGLATGYRGDSDGVFRDVNVVSVPNTNHSDMWSSTLLNATDAYFRNLYNNTSELTVRTDGRPKLGLNVRCLKD